LLNLKTLKVEWPTVSLILATYLGWLAVVSLGNTLNPAIWIICIALLTTLFMSITHEVVHGHPTRNLKLNQLLILMPLGCVIPYERFRDTHIEHHETGELTDPFDDPESWYVTGNQWRNTSWVLQKLLEFNNTLCGRMMIGPMIGMSKFYINEIALIVQDKNLRPYLIHVWSKHIILCSLLILFILQVTNIPLWQFVCAVYLSVSLLMVRTFLEHQASPDMGERTVVIERNCPLAFLFLYNNLHIVHHQRPGIAWYDLPKTYYNDRENYLALNKSYVYKSYSEIFRKYFFKMKEPVSHPLRQDTL